MSLLCLLTYVSESLSNGTGTKIDNSNTQVPLAVKFGIDANNVFGFWDWVGGRYSVCSAVGMMPLSLQYGYDVMSDFLKGAHSIDRHVLTTPLEKNIPALLGLLGIWNSTFLGYKTRALLPYVQKFLILFFEYPRSSSNTNTRNTATGTLKHYFDFPHIFSKSIWRVTVSRLP